MTCPRASRSTTSAASCARAACASREISKSNALGIKNRGDVSLVLAADDHPLDADPYSDNVIDICPVGALLSKPFLYKARVWYLKPTPSVCPGCERGCSVNIWHRKAEWHLRALDPKQNASISRVTPLENPAVNGPWICNKGRDLAQVFERARAEEALLKGRPVELESAIAAARALIGAARRPVALVSNWGSNEELAAFDTCARRALRVVRQDRLPPRAGRADRGRPPHQGRQEPEQRRRASSSRRLPAEERDAFPADCDLVLVWGEGCSFARCRRRQSRLPRRLAASGERPRRRLPADQRADRAQRPLHQLRRRRQPLRCVLRKKPGVADARPSSRRSRPLLADAP